MNLGNIRSTDDGLSYVSCWKRMWSIDMDLSDSWEKADFAKQWSIAEPQLRATEAGNIPAVFGSLIALFSHYIPKDHKYKLLDCACASGYYFDVIETLSDHDIHYTGSVLALSAVR